MAKSQKFSTNFEGFRWVGVFDNIFRRISKDRGFLQIFWRFSTNFVGFLTKFSEVSNKRLRVLIDCQGFLTAIGGFRKKFEVFDKLSGVFDKINKMKSLKKVKTQKLWIPRFFLNSTRSPFWCFWKAPLKVFKFTLNSFESFKLLFHILQRSKTPSKNSHQTCCAHNFVFQLLYCYWSEFLVNKKEMVFR